MQECNATAQRIETASAPTALAAVSALGAARQHEPFVGLNVHKGASPAAVAEPRRSGPVYRGAMAKTPTKVAPPGPAQKTHQPRITSAR